MASMGRTKFDLFSFALLIAALAIDPAAAFGFSVPDFGSITKSIDDSVYAFVLAVFDCFGSFCEIFESIQLAWK